MPDFHDKDINEKRKRRRQPTATMLMATRGEGKPRFADTDFIHCPNHFPAPDGSPHSSSGDSGEREGDWASSFCGFPMDLIWTSGLTGLGNRVVSRHFKKSCRENSGGAAGKWNRLVVLSTESAQRVYSVRLFLPAVAGLLTFVNSTARPLPHRLFNLM